MEKLHHLNNLHLQDHFFISTFSSQLFILFYSSGQSCPNLITMKLLKILIPPLYLIICFTYSVLMYLLLLHALYFLFLLPSSASIHPSRFNAPLFLFCSSISRFYASSLFLSPADTSLHPFCPPPRPPCRPSPPSVPFICIYFPAAAVAGLASSFRACIVTFM